MKKFKDGKGNLTMRFPLLLIIIVCIAVLVTSCSKSEKTEAGPVTSALFMNAFPKSVDFFVDFQKINSELVPFLQGLPYFNIPSGQRRVDITLGTVQVVASDNNTNYDAGKYYSVFLTGKTTPELIITEDDMTTPPLGKARIRLVQLSPDAPNLDVSIQGGPVLFSDQTYKSHTDFINIDPGNYTLNVRQTGNNTVKLSKIDVQIDGGGIHTIVVAGLWNNTASEPPLDIKILKNK